MSGCQANFKGGGSNMLSRISSNVGLSGGSCHTKFKGGSGMLARLSSNVGLTGGGGGVNSRVAGAGNADSFMGGRRRRRASKTRKSRRASKTKKSRRGSKSKKSKRGSKSKTSRRNKTRRSKKGGSSLSMTNPPSIGDCVKKGKMGIHTYKVVEVKGSDGFGMPTILVKDSDEVITRHNLRDMVRCNLKGGNKI
jgi:hypothetical protein